MAATVQHTRHPAHRQLDRHRRRRRLGLVEHDLHSARLNRRRTLFGALFHRRTRASYVYNGCLAWYNVVFTPRIHSSVKFVGLPLATRAMVE